MLGSNRSDGRPRVYDRYTPLFHDRWFWQLSNSASCWLIRPALGHRPVRERIAPMPVIGPRTLCAQSFSKALALPTSRGHLFGSAYHWEFIAAPPYPNAHSVHTFMLAPEPKPPKAMALPRTIPQVVEVDGARAPPGFGPRLHSIVLQICSTPRNGPATKHEHGAAPAQSPPG